MKILRHLQVPTGDILVVQGEKGLLELVSLGDYGQEKNLKSLLKHRMLLLLRMLHTLRIILPSTIDIRQYLYVI
jgi:hypothetical protein